MTKDFHHGLLDAVLHPSMVSALIAGLKDQFVNNGTRVIMATHSVTTVSLLEEGEVFRVARNGGRVDVWLALRSEAVSELSEGLATIDTGLRIAASGGAAKITILTEGNNTHHLKRWVKSFFSVTIHVFDDLPARTVEKQLLAYGQLLAKMDANSHFLIVWDCDAEGTAKTLRHELSGTEKVTPFSFKKRTNRVASRGIENNYDEKYLKDYSNVTLDAATRSEEIASSMSAQQKKAFAEHVASNGTDEYFEHFNDLKMIVEEILQKVATAQRGPAG